MSGISIFTASIFCPTFTPHCMSGCEEVAAVFTSACAPHCT